MANWDNANPDDNDIVSQYPSNERAARAAVITNFGVDHHATDDVDVGKHRVVQIVDNAADPTIAAGQVGIWNKDGTLKTRAGGGAVQDLIPPAPAAEIGSGARMVFYQASVPTGWTQDTSVNDRVLKVVSGAGGGIGGSWTVSGITVNNTALSIAQLPVHDHSASTGNAGAHSHGASSGADGGHSHSGSTNTTGNHRHGIVTGVAGAAGQGSVYEEYGNDTGFTDYAGNHSHSLSINAVGNHSHTISAQADHSHTVSVGSTGSGSGHNHTAGQDGTWRPSHIDVIVGTKD